MKDLYSENYKTLVKEIKEGSKKWNDNPCSWIKRFNVKMAILPKAINRFNVTCNKLPMTFFTELEQIIKILYGTTKDSELPKQSWLGGGGQAGGITFPDFSQYYKATIIKTVWCWYQDRQTDRPVEQNREPGNKP